MFLLFFGIKLSKDIKNQYIFLFFTLFPKYVSLKDPSLLKFFCTVRINNIYFRIVINC